MPRPKRPTTKLIPVKRSLEQDQLTELQQLNPLKRITRAMTSRSITNNTNSSIAGENPLSNNSNSTDHQINLLVSNNKYEIPTTYKQAMKTQQKKLWMKASQDELNAMKALNVYKLVNKNKLQGQSIIKGRWVFNVKQEADGSERFKARLVAKGFTQELGQNYIETFSPVISMDSIRFLFSMCAINGWYISQMDAKNAFLNGKLKYEIYFQPAEGCGIQQNKIWKLNKAL